MAVDAETRLQRTNVTVMERMQLATTRETMYALAAEFTQFKTESQASLLHLRPVDTEGKTYYIDGRVEWNNSLEGLAGQAWEGLKDLASGTKEALIRGPFTTEENYAICQSALGGMLPDVVGVMLPAPGGRPGAFLWDEALGQSLNAADPAGEMCRTVYPKGTSPQDIWRQGELEGVDDEEVMAGDATSGQFVPLRDLDAWWLQVMSDSKIQTTWDKIADACNALMGSEAVPHWGTPESLFAQGAEQDLAESGDGAWDTEWGVAEFAPGIDGDQLWFRQTGLDFEADAIGNGEGIGADQWFGDGTSSVDGYADGGAQPLFSDQVDALVQAMADFAPRTAGQTALAPTPYASVPAPVLASNWT